MDFEKKLEEIRTEINSMSKKIIKLRYKYKSLKNLFLLEQVKSETEKVVRKKNGSKYKDKKMRVLDRFYGD